MKIMDTGVEIKSERLNQTRIAWAVCGSIGAVESVRLIREVRRHGAEVTAFFTKDAEIFIGRTALEWATTRPAISEIGPDADHLHRFDLVVVCPLTLNTFVKAALGICDNGVSLLIASQLGAKRPLLFVPVMNAQLWRHPLYTIYMDQLRAWGVKFYSPEETEGRLKMPVPETLAEVILGLCDVSRSRN